MCDNYKQADLFKLAGAFFDNVQRNQDYEYGTIGIDGKRPFGNSDVEADILEIIGSKPEGDDGYEECYSSKQREYAAGLYDALPDYLREVWREYEEAHDADK